MYMHYGVWDGGGEDREDKKRRNQMGKWKEGKNIKIKDDVVRRKRNSNYFIIILFFHHLSCLNYKYFHDLVSSLSHQKSTTRHAKSCPQPPPPRTPCQQTLPSPNPQTVQTPWHPLGLRSRLPQAKPQR